MSTTSDLTTLGWRNGSATSIRDFQRMWNLGAQLSADGIAGPKTREALALSMARRAKGQGDISEHFNAKEFACECGGKYSNCRRIWTPRAVVRGLEVMRTKLGPFSPDRAGRCTQQNANVGGAPRSLHLTGWAIDLPVFKFTISQWRALGLWSGLGYYDYGSGRVYIRHCDMRHLAGHTSPPGSPATWAYPNPEKHVPRTPTSPTSPTSPTKPTTPTKPPPLPPLPTNWFLTEDGINGLGTRKAIQRMLGASTVDGDWGPNTRKGIQRWAGVTADGVIGPATARAVQKKVGVPQTGVWNWAWDSRPDPTTKGLQAYYNRVVRNTRKPIT